MSNTDARPATLDINYILKVQQNKYPVLLVDRIIELKPGKSAVGIKCFSYNEWFFQGHFLDDPIVPGFVQIETLVQTFLVTFLSLEEYSGKKTSFVSIQQAKFFRSIIPGDLLRIVASLDSIRHGIARGSSQGFVDNVLSCSAEFVIAIPDVVRKLTPQPPT